MLKTSGSTSRGKTRMMVSVVISSATRVPGLSLLRSSLLRQPTTQRGPLDVLTMTMHREDVDAHGARMDVKQK